MKTKQKGYLNIPNGFFETLLKLAIVGVISLFGLGIWFLWWLVTSIRFFG